MYKVMLVDDERIILEGISAIVDWSSADTVLIGKARNGIEAYERIVKEPPDIIVSDVKMPGMDGLELAAKVSQKYPAIRFIMLSGFSDFEYAQTAMRYGVKHYLVKPCNENKIVEALREVVSELKQSEHREQFTSSMREGLVKVLPYVKEQFLKEFVTNKTYGSKDWEYYRKLFDLRLEAKQVRLLLFQLEGKFEFEHMFAVKNIAEEILSRPVLSSTVGEHVLIVIDDEEPLDELLERISNIRTTFRSYYKIDLTIALSESGQMAEARKLYKQTLECLNHRFYLGEGSLITQRDILGSACNKEVKEFNYDGEALILQIKTGRWEDASKEIDGFFGQLGELRLDIQNAKSYVIELFTAMIRLSPPQTFKLYMDKLVGLIRLDTLQSIQMFFKTVAEELTKQQYEHHKNKYSAIVSKVIAIVEEHLGNPELSLNWVAHQMLYMNADYLGKLFKRETGEKFSNYVINVRVNKAIEWMKQHEDLKVFELAERLGFGDNPQYFSQVFKKCTGSTPSEFIKSPSH